MVAEAAEVERQVKDGDVAAKAAEGRRGKGNGGAAAVTAAKGWRSTANGGAVAVRAAEAGRGGGERRQLYQLEEQRLLRLPRQPPHLCGHVRQDKWGHVRQDKCGHVRQCETAVGGQR